MSGEPAVSSDSVALDGRALGRRGQQTRTRLLEATAQMLERVGLRDLRVVDIARVVGTSPATFYQYFRDVEEAVLALAERWGAFPPLERQHGHNPALRAASLQLQSEGAGALLTISADLPLLAPRDIITMFELSRQSDVVLAPSHEGTGTNALLVRPPLAIPYRFGSDSRARHLEAARERHLSSALYQSYSLAFDIDTIEDVRELERVCPAWREQPKMTV